jgi:phosphopantothenoylcysteine decarboxylase / phosphopantothenate---cysteine ligase
MLKGKKILLGISGGIAAYKSMYLIRLFRKAGAEVRVVATESAMWFVTRVTIESLSQNKLYNKVFGEDNDYTTEHISLTDWGDVFVVAPATANILGKFANGIADDALSTSLIAFDKKVFMAPAMNCKMYENFAFQRNLDYLKQNNVEIIEPASGYLACGYEGKGRMEEPEEIFAHVEKYFSAMKDLEGKKVLITAGPTRENIDPVRYIGNHSTGKMGFAIAEELAERGADVKLVSGPVNLELKNPSIQRIDVTSADEMYKVCKDIFPAMDAAILTAAVADYKPAEVHNKKIKRDGQPVILELLPNPDILASLGQMKKENQVLAGFALETDNELDNARKKLQKKNLDFIVLNSLQDTGAGFGTDTNKITILDNKNQVSGFELKSKKLVAADVADKLAGSFNALL